MNPIRRQRTRCSGRSTLLLSSVLALLALACFPVLAQAGEGSGTVQYHSTLPNAEGNGPSAGENIATKSQKGNGGAEAPSNAGSTGPSAGYSEEAPSESENAGAATGGNGGGSGQGKPDQSANPGGKAGLQDSAPPTKASSDGGSSPLVPILIAIAVLAAISIAVVTIRQRRQRDGSSPSLSTKVG